MADRIIKKKYCRITFALASPLAVGSGSNASSDKDIIRDTRGVPYIPASAMAGVCRSCLVGRNEMVGEVKQYFGHVSINGKKDAARDKGTIEQMESRLIFYDGIIIEAKSTAGSKAYHTTLRDSVSLDEHKNAVAGAKFDMEVLQPGIQMRTWLEQSFYSDEEKDYTRKVVDILRSGRAAFGAKTMRGYGAIKVTEVLEKEFRLDDRQVNDWIAWLARDLESEEAWSDAAPYVGITPISDNRQLRLSLRLRGGISIRKYTTRPKDKGSTRAVPDFEQLTAYVPKEAGESGEDLKVPVIPGTSWAGAIRHRMQELGMTREQTGDLFGYVSSDRKNDKARSVIRFGESQIEDGNWKEVSRNAIDRFSGGTVSGALYTERTYYGGKTDLVISFDPNAVQRLWQSAEKRRDEAKREGKPVIESEKYIDGMASYLAAALTDLGNGYLAVGGETSIGRGLFSIEKINDRTAPEGEELYTMLYQESRRCLTGKECGCSYGIF